MPPAWSLRLGKRDVRVTFQKTITSGGLNFQSDHITGKFINVTAVPEPSTYALLAVGAIIWAGFAKRRWNSGRLTPLTDSRVH